MNEIWAIFAIIVAVIVLFIWDRLPVIAVCVGCAIALWATGIVTLQESLAGFGDPATVFVASLFVASAALEKTGITAWTGQVLMRGAGDSRNKLIGFMMLIVGVLTALISVNGAVAALLPVIVVMAVRLQRPPSQLLLPLVYGAHSGSLLALTGTPVNVLVLEASLEAGERGFGYFEFALVGIPLVIGGIAIAILLGPRLLPVREVQALPPDLSDHARTLVEQFGLTHDVHLLRVRADSPLVGSQRADLLLADYPGLTLRTMRAAGNTGVLRLRVIEPDDVLLVQGPPEEIAQLCRDAHLSPRTDPDDGVVATLFNRGSGLAEVVVPPRSALIGQRMFPGMVTQSGDLVVLAVTRQGIELPQGELIAAGDTMLLQGTWEALDKHLAPPEILVVNSPDLVRRQALPMGPGATTALGVMAAMVILLATGLVPAAVAGLLSAGAMLLLGLLSVPEVYRAINWTTVILVGAMMPLSTAISATGAAQLLADGLVQTLGGFGPRALIAGLFLLTAILGQVISNTATALIIIPIAVVAAQDMGVSPQPVLMAVAVAAAASFFTPVATPTNLMVMEPGGYRFGDYWKFGLPLMLLYFVAAVWLVPVIWRF
jgi:di/tricarboxylate transporter